MKTGKSGRARKAIQIVLAAGMAIGASQQALAGSIFLSIPGIPGESLDSKHKDQIDIESFSQSLERGGDCQLSFSKRVDKSTPLLAESLAKGKAIPSATLVVTRQTGKDQPEEYIKLTMSSVTVLSSDIAVSDEVAYENFAVNARSILIGLSPQGPDGKLLPAVNRTIMCGTGGKL